MPTDEIVEQHTDRCLWCGKTRGGHDNFACVKWVDSADLCAWCDGTGREATDSDFTDGRRCRHCAGEGAVTA